MFMQVIIEFFQNNLIAKIILDGYLALLFISLIVFLVFKFRKALNLLIIGMLIFAGYFLSKMLNLELSYKIYEYVLSIYGVVFVILMGPDLRKMFEYRRISENKDALIYATGETKEAIAEAVFNLSSNKVGALITIEQHNSLDQYAQRAIQLNSDISKELLEQIFIKDSPLHDGGVIIRGNKIICAGAYYVLTQDESLDKTIGSRHRAGVGVSEVTDSLTIIVSEETGIVHVANAGFMKIMDNKRELLEYLNLFLGR
jgi:diadenylate cyclase